jgi:hypothetical protein
MKSKKIKYTKQQVNITRIAKIVGIMLLVPLFGNYLIEGQAWGLGDFVFAAIMLFGAGYALEYSQVSIKDSTHRLVAIAAIVAAFLLIWAELAVGIFD